MVCEEIIDGNFELCKREEEVGLMYLIMPLAILYSQLHFITRLTKNQRSYFFAAPPPHPTDSIQNLVLVLTCSSQFALTDLGRSITTNALTRITD